MDKETGLTYGHVIVIALALVVGHLLAIKLGII